MAIVQRIATYYPEMTAVLGSSDDNDHPITISFRKIVSPPCETDTETAHFALRKSGVSDPTQLATLTKQLEDHLKTTSIIWKTTTIEFNTRITFIQAPEDVLKIEPADPNTWKRPGDKVNGFVMIPWGADFMHYVPKFEPKPEPEKESSDIQVGVFTMGGGGMMFRGRYSLEEMAAGKDKNGETIPM